MLLTNESALQENKEIEIPEISLWSRSGPGLLLAAFAIFLFKTAPIYWPLTLTAFLGYAIIRLWKKNGLLLSLVILSSVSIFSFRSNEEHLWISILSGSIALAWLLIYLGGLDTEAFAQRREETIRSLIQERQNLEKQIREIKASLSTEKHKSNMQASESLLALTKAAQLTEAAEREKQTLLEKCNTLSKNVSIRLNNESLLQQALDNAQTQISQLHTQLADLSKFQEASPCQETVYNQIEESNSEEPLQLKQLQYQLTLLREQFDEKSDALDKARKDLFATENELLVLKKVQEEKKHEAPEEIVAYSRDLKSLELTCIEMENQVHTLQDVISTLLTTKTRIAPKAKARAPTKKTSPDLF